MNKYTLKQFLDTTSSRGGSFSPDGSRIAFQNNKTGTTQIYLSDTDGNNIKQLTDYEDRIIFSLFLPTENKILFGKDLGGNEKTQFYLYDVDTDMVDEITESDEVMHRVGGISRDGKQITFVSNERNGKDFDVYVMSLESQEKKCIYKDRGWCDSLGFSAHGDKVLVRDRDSIVNGQLVMVDIDSGDIEQITDPDKRALYGFPRWLSDNSGFYFISNEASDFTCVDFYHVVTKEITRKLSYEWDVEEINLSLDDTFLSVILNEDGYDTVRFYNPKKDVEEIIGLDLPDGMIWNIGWTKDGSKFCFSYGDPVTVASIWVHDIQKSASCQVSPDGQSVPGDDLVKPELIHYKSFDGLSIPVFLYLPKDYTGPPLSVIVQIHGGPEGQYTPNFNSITQYFINNGYAVAAPNVRGSSGYGKHYMTLDDKDKRLDSVQDIVYLRHYLKEREEIDESKVILMGGSYGGYMVLANLAFYPEYWAAGIDIVGISNLVSFLENTSEWRRSLREAEYGSLEHDRDMLKDVSPINKVGSIVAPLFIIHGANDPRVPLSEAEQITDKLKELDRDVELIVYDDEGHGLSKLENRIDAYTKVVKFLDSRLK
jgi:dipeptidyl aminopeptidase/acylaminoacyl peptidase